METPAASLIDRRFPLVTERLFSDNEPLATLIDHVGLGNALWPGRIDPPRRFRRIVTAHRSAFEAEIGGMWNRADFYWIELRRLLHQTKPEDACWTAGARALPLYSNNLTAGEFWQHFLTEIVIETHVQFFRSQVDGGLSPLSRPKVHLEALHDLFHSFPEFTDEYEAKVMDELATIGVSFYRSRHHEGGVQSFLGELVQSFRRQGQYLDALLGEIHSETMQQLSEPKADKRKILNETLDRVESLRKQSPHTFACYQLLGLLYHEQSIQLANAGAISDSFVALEKAAAFGGAHPVLADTRRQLEEILLALRRAAEQVRQNIRLKPGATLTPKGAQLIRDADNGTQPAEKWGRSREAHEIQAKRDTARQTPKRQISKTAPMHGGSIRLKKTSRVAGHERFTDWLNTPRAVRLKAQIVAALILTVLATGLSVRESWAARKHRLSWQNVEIVAGTNDNVGLLNALSSYFDLPETHARDPHKDNAVRLYSNTVARWLSSKSQTLSVDDRQRLERYRRQIVDRHLDEKGASQ